MLAQEESRLLGHAFIGTEHLLLGLVREGEGFAAKALASMGVELDRVRTAVDEKVGRGKGAPDGHIPFTPRAKKVLELSLREALQLGHNYIGTEHILLGLVSEGEGVAAEVLTGMGVELAAARAKVIELLKGYGGPAAAQAASEPIGAPVSPPTCPMCRSSLDGRLRTQALSATAKDDETITSAVTVVYCGSCGHSLGLLPAQPPSS